MTGEVNSGNGTPAPSATPTSGALTKAGERLRKRELAARRAGAAITAGTSAIPKPRRKTRLPTAQDLERIAVMKSQGLQNHQIARGLQVTAHAVVLALKDPGVVGQIVMFRERLKGVHVAAAHAIASKAWEKAEVALDAEDAKSFDAYTRGIHAMEKVAASASGENQRMEVTHQGKIDTAPVKVQLQQLIALVRQESI